MRVLSILTVLAFAQIGAAWALGDLNTARPGGVFSSIEAEDAQSCERLCAEDTLCMAWSYRENACDLKAVVPAAIDQTGTISGVNHRAPASLRTRTIVQTAATPPVAEATPPLIEIEAELSTPALAEDDISNQLLGGLDPADDLQISSYR